MLFIEKIVTESLRAVSSAGKVLSGHYKSGEMDASIRRPLDMKLLAKLLSRQQYQGPLEGREQRAPPAARASGVNFHNHTRPEQAASSG